QHDSFESPGVLAADAPADDRERPARAAHGETGWCVTEHEVEHSSGAEGDLDVAAVEAALPEQRCLLVTGDPCDRRRARERGRVPDDAGRVEDAPQPRL